MASAWAAVVIESRWARRRAAFCLWPAISRSSRVRRVSSRVSASGAAVTSRCAAFKAAWRPEPLPRAERAEPGRAARAPVQAPAALPGFRSAPASVTRSLTSRRRDGEPRSTAGRSHRTGLHRRKVCGEISCRASCEAPTCPCPRRESMAAESREVDFRNNQPGSMD